MGAAQSTPDLKVHFSTSCCNKVEKLQSKTMMKRQKQSPKQQKSLSNQIYTKEKIGFKEVSIHVKTKPKKPLMKQMKSSKDLNQIWYNPEDPAGFRGVSSLAKASGKQGRRHKNG